MSKTDIGAKVHGHLCISSNTKSKLDILRSGILSYNNIINYLLVRSGFEKPSDMKNYEMISRVVNTAANINKANDLGQ